MDDLNTLGSLGLHWPSPAYLFGMLLFSLLGFAAYRYGKKAEKPRTRWLGVVLMFYPYAVTGTAWLYVVGLGLCALVVLDKG